MFATQPRCASKLPSSGPSLVIGLVLVSPGILTFHFATGIHEYERIFASSNSWTPGLVRRGPQLLFEFIEGPPPLEDPLPAAPSTRYVFSVATAPEVEQWWHQTAPSLSPIVGVGEETTVPKRYNALFSRMVRPSKRLDTIKS